MAQKNFIKKHLKHEATLIMVLKNQDHRIYKEINSHSCFQGESGSNFALKLIFQPHSYEILMVS